MASILLVSENRSFMVYALEKQFEAGGYKVTQVGNNIAEIDEITAPQRLIFIYAEGLSLRQRGLIALGERAEADNIPIFVYGNNEQISNIEQIIPEGLIYKKLHPPINVKDIVGMVGSALADDRYKMMNVRKKILVVDDSGAMLRTVKEWLQDRYDVVLANSGVMAIKYLATDRPDLILLDYEMPICDGKQVLEMIRAEKEFASIPVIFLTNKNDRESVLNVSALKPDGYLLKTMEPAQIVQSINTFFIKQRKV